MKNWMKAGLLAGILIVSAAIGTAVCSVNKKHPEEDSRTDFVFIAPVKWNRIARGAMAAEEDFGVSVKYFTFSQNEEKQIEAMRYALLSDADGIITAGMHTSEQLEDTICQIQEEGVPVVFVDSDIEGSSRSCYIGCDNYEIGRLAGMAVKEARGGQAKVCLVISNSETATPERKWKR